jgi:hypothetical protein
LLLFSQSPAITLLKRYIMTTPATYTVTATDLANGFEEFKFIAETGQLTAAEAQALVTFFRDANPALILKGFHALLIHYLQSGGDSIEPRTIDSFNEFLQLCTDLWAAERSQHKTN